MFSRHLTTISKRAASAAATRTATESVTKLPNGLTVASIEQHGVASQVVVAFNAGSRYETSDNQGTVHLLRNAVGTDSKDFPGLTLVWNSAALGGEVTATSTRDVFAVRLAVPRENSNVAVSILGELANPKCKPWDIEEVAGEVKKDVPYRCKWASTVDNLHAAAYRNGSLANSNYIQNNTPGFKVVQDFKDKYFRSGNAVVVGVNIDHDALVQGASTFRLDEGKPSAPEHSKYFGGEYRHSAGGPTTIVAIAGEGAALSNVAEAAAQSVAAEILTALATKAGAAANGAVNLSYSDSGLLGVVFSSENNQIGQLTKAVATAFKSAKVDDASIAVAKRKAALKVLTAAESGAALALDGAIQLLSTGNSVSPAEFSDAITNVSASDVNKALSKAASKLSLSSYGQIRNVPYLDEL